MADRPRAPDGRGVPLKRYRLLVVAAVGLAAVLTGLLLFGNLNGNLVYFLSPQEAIARQGEFGEDRRFQLGGLVEQGSVVRAADGLRFVVTSEDRADAASIAVRYTGTPAQLFQDGIGVILEGAWQGSEFVSDTMIVKHDENYSPPTPTGLAP